MSLYYTTLKRVSRVLVNVRERESSTERQSRAGIARGNGEVRRSRLLGARRTDPSLSVSLPSSFAFHLGSFSFSFSLLCLRLFSSTCFSSLVLLSSPLSLSLSLSLSSTFAHVCVSRCRFFFPRSSISSCPRGGSRCSEVRLEQPNLALSRNLICRSV